MSRRLRILHLSDLHERKAVPGMDEERLAKIRLGMARRTRVLEANFLSVLTEISQNGPIDLICFTGDIADWGLAEEYVDAEARIRKILQAAQVPIDRLFLVPGNHDVQRPIAHDAWEEMRQLATKRLPALSDWMGGRMAPDGAVPIWRDDVLSRTAAFWDWVRGTLGRADLDPRTNVHQQLGYRISIPKLGFSFPVYIIGLDSAWLSGDSNDAKKLALTDGQLNVLARDNGQLLDGFRLALVHHPLSDLIDGTRARRLLSETVDLLLYGHQHEPGIQTIEDPNGRLRTIAAGSLYEGDLGDRWSNGFHLIDAHLDPSGRPLCYEIEFWGWSDQGHWHRNAAVYREARDGRLVWWTPLGKSQQPGTTSPSLNAFAARELSGSGTEPVAFTPLISAAPANCLSVPSIRPPIAPAHSGYQQTPLTSFGDITGPAQIKALADLSDASGLKLITALQTTRSPSPPPLPIGYISRPDVVATLAGMLAHNAVLAVIGYEECGKTAVMAEFCIERQPTFWCSLPPESDIDGSGATILLFALSVFLGAHSIALADLDAALCSVLEQSQLLMVIDNAHTLGDIGALDILFRRAEANGRLRIILLATDLPEFVAKMHKSGIVTWRVQLRTRSIMRFSNSLTQFTQPTYPT